MGYKACLQSYAIWFSSSESWFSERLIFGRSESNWLIVFGWLVVKWFIKEKSIPERRVYVGSRWGSRWSRFFALPSVSTNFRHDLLRFLGGVPGFFAIWHMRIDSSLKWSWGIATKRPLISVLKIKLFYISCKFMLKTLTI